MRLYIFNSDSKCTYIHGTWYSAPYFDQLEEIPEMHDSVLEQAGNVQQ